MGQGQVKYETLTPIEKKVIVESWGVIRRRISKCGLSLFMIFFQDYPQHKSYFPEDFSLDEEDILEDHGLKVLRQMSRIVRYIDAVSHIFPILQDIAVNHKRREISKQALDDFRAAFVKMIKKQLASEINLEAILKAWDKGMRTILQILYDLMCMENPRRVSVFSTSSRGTRSATSYAPP